MVQFSNSPGGLLEDFSVVNDASISFAEDNINVYESNNVTIRRGLIDGNNSPTGIGVMVENGSNGVVVEDVDCIRMGNGSFTVTNNGTCTWRRCRTREDICSDQGRGLPTSTGLAWYVTAGSTATLEECVYYDLCNQVTAGFGTFVGSPTEEDFTLRPGVSIPHPAFEGVGLAIWPEVTTQEYSRDFTSWTDVGTSPTDTQDEIGIDGGTTTASTLTDNDGSGHEGWKLTESLSSNTNDHTGWAIVRKDTDETRFVGLALVTAGGTAQSHYQQYNTKTGANAQEAKTGTGSAGVIDLGEWWMLWLSLESLSANTSIEFHVYPARGTVIGTANTAATGSIVCDRAGLSLNEKVPLPIITTTTSAVTRTDDEPTDPYHGLSSQGTFVVDFMIPVLTGSTQRVATIQADGSNWVQVRVTSGGDIQFRSQGQGVGNGDNTVVAATAGVLHRIAVSWHPNGDAYGNVDGTDADSDTGWTLPIGLDTIGLAIDGSGNNPASLFVKRIRYSTRTYDAAGVARLATQ